MFSLEINGFYGWQIAYTKQYRMRTKNVYSHGATVNDFETSFETMLEVIRKP